MHPTTVAVVLAKNVFELAVADIHWQVVARHRFTRRQFERFPANQPRCHVVMEACGTAHHWGRVAQGRGNNKATMALANKLARIVWAVWRSDGTFAAAPARAA